MNLESEISNSKELTQWIHSKMHGLKFSTDERCLVAVGCLDMAHEHQESVVLLSVHHLYGPAFALVRLAFESLVKGLWFFNCASDEDIEQFKKDKLDKKFYQLIKKVEKLEDFNVGTLLTVKEKSWKTMNNFTHCGSQQIARRMTQEEITPNYTDDEIIDALQSANSYAILAAFEIAKIAKNENLCKVISDMGLKYFADFKAISTYESLKD